MPLGTEVDLGTGHIVDGVPAVWERGTAAPSFRACLLWPRSPISATAELLLTQCDQWVQIFWTILYIAHTHTHTLTIHEINNI